MNKFQKDCKDADHHSWRHVVDKVVDCISSSKSTLGILNDKQNIGDEKKSEIARQHAKEAIIRKLLKEFVIGNQSKADKVTQLHINESFRDSDSKVKCSAAYNGGPLETRNSPRQRRLSLNFLDEQYNLTKQAIARRYRPQMKINLLTAKNNMMRDYFEEPYDQNFHRIANVASEKIPVYQIKKKHAKTTEKCSPETAPKSSDKKTYVIFEK